jgi:small subunit ribosomal protein S16
MATRIRLKRGGRKGKPYYRIVVQDSRVRSRGRELDIIGFYHPAAQPEPMSEVDVHKALGWLRNGAQMSDTARSVMSKLGVLKHYHEGTTPEETTATLKGGVVENKGYNAPPPPVEETPEAPAAEETPADEAPVEAVAEDAVAEAVAEDAPAETDGDAAAEDA